MSALANHLARNGHEITLITYVANEKDFYILDEKIKRVKISPKKFKYLNAILANFQRLIDLRSEILFSKPEVLISFMDTVNVLTLVATVNTNIPVIISERIDPRHHQTKIAWRLLRVIFYPFASGLVIQTKNLQKWANKKIKPEKVYVIPNPVIHPIQRNKIELSVLPDSFVLAVGRLEFQKGFDELISMFKKVSDEHPNWHLVIAGEGKERGYLESLIIDVGLRGKVHLLGEIQAIPELMSKAKIFALSSRFEGFPNVLIEAMSSGLAVVSFDCPSGPNEIITNRKNGLLIPVSDKLEFQDALLELIRNPELRLRLGEDARNVSNTFSEKSVFQEWLRVIQFILDKRKL